MKRARHDDSKPDANAGASSPAGPTTAATQADTAGEAASVARAGLNENENDSAMPTRGAMSASSAAGLDASVAHMLGNPGGASSSGLGDLMQVCPFLHDALAGVVPYHHNQMYPHTMAFNM